MCNDVTHYPSDGDGARIETDPMLITRTAERLVADWPPLTTTQREIIRGAFRLPARAA